MKLRPYHYYGSSVIYGEHVIYASQQYLFPPKWVTWLTYSQEEKSMCLTIKVHPSTIITEAQETVTVEGNRISISVKAGKRSGLLYEYDAIKIEIKLNEIRGLTIMEAHTLLHKRYAAHAEMLNLLLTK